MSKEDLARVSDKEARQAWGRKWSGVGGSAPPKDAARKSANRNEFHWSADAAAFFQDAVTELGGPSSATANAILEILSLGPLQILSHAQVKSRLQCVRNKMRVESRPQARDATSLPLELHAVEPAAPAPKKLKRKRAYSSGNVSDDDFDC
jgi:SHAQKYF class myb-like DNA-binding protein